MHHDNFGELREDNGHKEQNEQNQRSKYMNNNDNFQNKVSSEQSKQSEQGNYEESEDFLQSLLNNLNNSTQDNKILSTVDYTVPQYFSSETHDRIFFAQKTKKGYEVITIANFCVWIDKEEIVHDEFGNTTRIYTIVGKNETGKKISPFKIEATEFGEMNWTDLYLGKDCYIYDKPKNKFRVYEAIQRHPFTSQAKTTTVYGYTGWLESDKGLRYLFPNFSQKKHNLEASLPDVLSAYSIPCATDQEKVEGLKKSLMFLSVANPRITIPLLATMYLAPLTSLVNADFTVWLYGETGSFKTTLTKHIMNHFGKFDNHVITWNATPNALERYASIIGDAPLVIDDYAPQPDQASQTRLDQTVERVIRDAGNNAGRARMKANLSLQHIYRKRGIIIATGEQLPKGQSVLARIYGISISKQDVNLSELKQAQLNREKHYGFATSAYIDWIEIVGAEKVKEIFEAAENTFIEKTNNDFQNSYTPDRLRQAAAKLYAAFEVMLQMMLQHGIVESVELEKFRNVAIQAIAANVLNFSEDFGNESVLQRVFETIETMIHTRQVVVVNAEEANSAQYTVPVIGYIDDVNLYLLWSVTYDQILKYLKSIGSPFTYTRLATQKALRNALCVDAPTMKRFGNIAKRVLAIPLHALKEKGFTFVEGIRTSNPNPNLPENF